jgi:hypothetical protein
MFPFLCSLIYYLLSARKLNEVYNSATCSTDIPFYVLNSIMEILTNFEGLQILVHLFKGSVSRTDYTAKIPCVNNK